ncbi:MAG: hypothetical protein INQ03_16865 [Candidatus Heimdallarchaeota archaeon]|nr:hypothetical protein [Candidatus Heimdallarchaeota archaeon]
MESEDRKYLRKLLVNHSLTDVLSMIETETQFHELQEKYEDLDDIIRNLYKELQDELESLFLFNIVGLAELDYIPLDNLIAFLLKIEPFVDNYNLDNIKINAVIINKVSYYPLSDLIELLDTLSPYINKFDLRAVADYILDQSKKRPSN